MVFYKVFVSLDHIGWNPVDLQSVWKLERIGLNPVALLEGLVKCFCLECKALSHVLCVLSHLRSFRVSL